MRPYLATAALIALSGCSDSKDPGSTASAPVTGAPAGHTAGASGTPSTVQQPPPSAAAGSLGAAAHSGGSGGSHAPSAGQSGSTPAANGGAGSAALVAGTGGSGGAASSAGAPGAGAPSPAAACDRACLTGFNESYLQALIANDASKLATAPTVKFTENGKLLSLSEGLWAVARSLGEYRQDFAEVSAGQTAGFVSLDDDRGDVLLAFRLKVEAQQVTEIETTVCRSGEATFFSPSALEHNPLYDQEVPADKRMPRDALIAIVDLYFKGIETSDGSGIPFADSARRNENGTTTGMGSALNNVAMFSYIEQIDRRYALVDEERGNVLPWVLFQIPMGLTGSRTLHLAELFKVEDDKIMDVQAIMVNQPLGTASGWE
ncbi:MAG: hypothetical protein ABW321_32425 [Polyangiales bacterium]